MRFLRRIFIYNLLPLFCIGFLNAQTDAHWRFGQGAGLDFSSGSPIFIGGSSMNAPAGCASISDESGNLLMYTDGATIWNSKNEIMEDGDGLLGNPNASQSAFFIDDPSAPSTYLLFTVDSRPGGPGLLYNVINAASNGGLGRVVKKNKPLLNSADEAFCIVKRSNCREYWLIVRKRTGGFASFLISEIGLYVTPVTSDVGSPRTDSGGYLKASRSGSKIASALYGEETVELFDFNALTGRLSNPIELSSLRYEGAYGLEFSPNESRLYLSELSPTSHIYQFDLTLSSSSSINNSAFAVAEEGYANKFGALQLGLDGKIYVAIRDSSFAGVIDNPDALRHNCNFSEKAVEFSDGAVCGLGLPQFLRGLCLPGVFAEVETPICAGEDLRFEASFVDGASYYWTGPEGFTSREQNPVIENVGLEHGGVYILKATKDGLESVVSVEAIVRPAAIAKILPSDTVEICEGSEAELRAETSYRKTNWTGGISGPSITVDSAGIYELFVENEFGCRDTARTVVIINPNPDFEIVASGPTSFCEGDSVVLSSSVEGTNLDFLWTNGSTELEIVVKQPGIYGLTVSNEFGCENYTEVEVEVFERLPVRIEAISSADFCEGDSAFFQAYPIEEDYEYLWSDGSTESSLTVFETGEYSVTITDPNGCSGDASVNATKHPKPIAKIIASGDLCGDDKVVLSAFPKGENFIYSWSTGETTDSIEVDKTGEYSVVVENEYGCSSEAAVEIDPGIPIDIKTVSPPGFCPGSSATLRVELGEGDYNILWSTGETADSIEVDEPGEYWVHVDSGPECSGSDTLYLEEFPEPRPDLGPDVTICSGSAKLIGSESEYESYLWSTGETTRRISVDRPGEYFVEVENEYGCVGSDTIEVSEIEVGLVFSNLSAGSFGKIFLGESRNDEILAINKGEEAIEINSARLAAGTPPFSLVVDPAPPINLEVGDTLRLSLGFDPDELAAYGDVLQIAVESPCPRTYSVPLSGVCRIVANVTAPRLREPVGTENVCFDFLAKLDPRSDTTLSLPLKCSVKFSDRIFLNKSITGAKLLVDDLSLDEQTIRFENDSVYLSDRVFVVATFCGDFLLGDSESSIIEIIDPDWSNEFVETSIANGSVESYGLCRPGLSRIETFDPLSANINPNPASSSATLKVEGSFAPVRIRIISPAGKTVSCDSFDEKKIEYSLDIDKLPTGIYFVEISNGYETATIKLAVVN